MKQRTALLLIAILFAGGASLRADSITYGQNPDPFKALEGTTGNVGFLTLTNTSTVDIATITSIIVIGLFPHGGEADDKATNLALVAPNPTPTSPLLIGLSSADTPATANIKFTWDAVDQIVDKDQDFGDWLASFTITYHYTGGADTTEHVFADLRVADLPEPSTLALLSTGGVGAIGCSSGDGRWARSREFC